jgi:hypothetical protein
MSLKKCYISNMMGFFIMNASAQPMCFCRPAILSLRRSTMQVGVSGSP